MTSGFDRQWYIECADQLPIRVGRFDEYNRVLIALIETNGFASFLDLNRRATRSIRGAAASCFQLQKMGFISLDKDACKATHRNQPLVWGINYDLIEQVACHT